jgi:Ca2+-binding RTX toxin-like protein
MKRFGTQDRIGLRNRTQNAPRNASGRKRSAFVDLESLESRRVLAYSAVFTGLNTVQWNGSDTVTPLEFSIVGGLYQHNQVGGGFVNGFDFDSVVPGVQPLAAAAGATNNIQSVGTGNQIVIDQSSVVNSIAASFYTSPGIGYVSTTLGDFSYTSSNSVIEYLGGSGGNEIYVSNNLAATTLRISSGTGSDSVWVQGNSGPTANTVMTYVDLGEGDDVAFISGVSRDVLVSGGAGDDVIDGSGVNVASLQLFGGSGDDQIKGGQFANTIEGNEGNDILAGGSGADKFTWRAGDGFDTVIGAGGSDEQLFYGNPLASNSITARRVGGALEVVMFGFGNVLATNVESLKIYGGISSDGIAIEDLSNTGVQAVEVNVSSSSTSSLAVIGTDGNDQITLSAVPSFANMLTVQGFTYGLTLVVDATRPADFTTYLSGIGGNDVIRAQPGTESRTRVVMFGGAGNDQLYGHGQLYGDEGNDTLQGAAGNDLLDGGVGDDVYLLSGGNDQIFDSGNLSDADSYRVDGTIGADNITISQTISAADSLVVVEYRDYLGNIYLTSVATVSFVPVIEVHTYENSDDLYINAVLAPGGFASNGLAVRAFMGQGNDFADASGVALDAVIPISVLGQVGNDTFIGGAGFDYFYGGEDSDTYVMNVSGPTPSSFEGGGGNDTLIVNAPNVNLFGQTDGMLTANISAGNQGWLYANGVYSVLLNGSDPANNTFNVFDLDYTTVRNVRIIGSGIANSANITGTNGDDLIRVAMADPNINPDTLQVSGLTYALYLSQWATGANVLTIDGSNGNDTFECLSNQDQTVIFNGGAGDDVLKVSAASVSAAFIGGDGNDSVNVQGTNNNDIIAVSELTSGLYYVVFTHTSIASGVESFKIDGNAGNDNISFVTLPPVSDPFAINAVINGGDGSDTITLGSVYNGNFEVNGGNGDDSIHGPTAVISAILRGNEGNDFITGGDAAELIEGGEGFDTLFGGAGDDTIDGGNGDDFIRGDLGNDYLSGGDGADLFAWIAGDGTDIVSGGLGQDTLTFRGLISGDNSFSIASNQGPAAPGIFGPGLSNLALTSLAGNGSVLSSDLEQVALYGGEDCNKFEVGNLQQTTVTLVDLNFGPHPDSGNLAIVYGTDTNDNVVVSSPQAGQVNVNGLPALVRMFGTNKAVDTLKLVTGAGNDNVSITPSAADQIFAIVDAGDGHDYVEGFSIAYGGTGNDTLIGTEGADTLVGGEGHDSIVGLGGDDTLIGDSIMFGDVADDAHSCGGDFPVIEIVGSATGGNDTIHGGTGNDTIQGNQANDLIFGDEGDDIILGQEGNDLVFAGAGNDSVFGHEGDDTLFGGEGADVIYGNDGNDSIVGEAGNDSVYGGFGNDTIHGGEGQDVLNGDEGDDYIFGDAGDDFIRGQDGNDYIAAGTGNDTVYGGIGADTVFGEEGADLIYGDDGNDIVYGGIGNDTVFAGTGSDAIYGGEGQDVLWGEEGDDFISGDQGDDAINGGVGNDFLMGGEGNDQIQALDGNDTVKGGAGDDLIVGGEGDDFLDGEEGNDVIWGLAGNDTIWGGFGHDMLYGGEGNDFILGGTPATANVMHKPRPKGLPNDGNDTILGGNGFDHVDGGNGDNLLDAGADYISETILGGSGNDIAYTHQATDANYDRTALDGGFQHIYKQGELSEPVPPAVAIGLVSYTVPAFYYTGHIFYQDGTVVEHPPLSELMKKGRVPSIQPKVKAIAKPNPKMMAASRLAALKAARAK